MELVTSPFQTFLLVLAAFHCSEVALSRFFHPKETSWQNWLFSKQYCAAMSLACVEYAVEARLFPGKLAVSRPVQTAGLVLVILGELVRKAAICTAGKSFTHVVATKRQQQHMLVTHGVYRLCRHPAYLGWFAWVVGTQVLLANPVCTVGFTAATWRFFKQRIAFEEAMLTQFFGDAYTAYRAATPTLIPFIR